VTIDERCYGYEPAHSQLMILREEVLRLKFALAKCDKDRLEALELCKPEFSREAAYNSGRKEAIREVAQHVTLAVHMGTPAEEIPQIILDILKADKIAEGS